MRLRSDYDLSGFTGGASVIAQAMKTYGMIVADNGSDWYFSGSSDPRWDDDEPQPAQGHSRLGVRGRALAGRDPRLLSR